MTLLWWGHPLYEPERIKFDALNLTGKAKSKRVKFTQGASYQAERSGSFVCVKVFSLGQRQEHLGFWFSARMWPAHPFDQSHFVQGILMDVERRVTGRGWHPDYARMAEKIICAVDQVLTPERKDTNEQATVE